MKSRREAKNVALRHQLIVLRRKVHGRKWLGPGPIPKVMQTPPYSFRVPRQNASVTLLVVIWEMSRKKE